MTGRSCPNSIFGIRRSASAPASPCPFCTAPATPATGLLTEEFAGRLFGPGQPLDAAKYFIILPDAIGHGGSSKPSDGLRMRFPKYDYDDQVEAQHRLLNEGLGVHHLRLVAGISMGGMETWLWGEKYPRLMDALAPMAAQPAPMASRNWMLRRLMTEMIRNDPEWMNGEYKSEPRSLRLAFALYSVATNGGTLAYQSLAPTRDKADKLVNEMLAKPLSAISSTSGNHRPTTTHRKISNGSRPRCLPLIRPMTKGTRPRLE